MIQAENPENLQNSQNTPLANTLSKVPGFSTPTEKLNQVQNSAQQTTQPQPQELHPEKSSTSHIRGTIFHWWHKLAVALLTVHGLTGLWESFQFILVEYPKLNQQLELHAVNTEEANHLLAKAIITLGVTLVNILFAIRLSKSKETTAHNVDLIVATFLIITSRLIQNFLFQLDLINYFLGIFS